MAEGTLHLQDSVAVDNRSILTSLIHEHVALLLLVKVHLGMQLQTNQNNCQTAFSSHEFESFQTQDHTLLTPISGIRIAWSMSFSLQHRQQRFSFFFF